MPSIQDSPWAVCTPRQQVNQPIQNMAASWERMHEFPTEECKMLNHDIPAFLASSNGLFVGVQPEILKTDLVSRSAPFSISVGTCKQVTYAASLRAVNSESKGSKPMALDFSPLCCHQMPHCCTASGANTADSRMLPTWLSRVCAI